MPKKTNPTRRDFLLRSTAGGVALVTGWPAKGLTPSAEHAPGFSGQPPAAEAWELNFATPPGQYRIGVYWWWFGPAQTKAEVTRELAVMRDAGIGYVLIFPLYPLSPDDPAKGIHNLQYLSAEFLEVLEFTAEKAKELEIDVDVLIGTGWPYGGPSITPELGAQRLRFEVIPVRNGTVTPATLRPYEKLEAGWLVSKHGDRVELKGARTSPIFLKVAHR